MIIKQGSLVRTLFLSGIVTEVIDGRDRSFWRDTLYFRVKVTKPKKCKDNLIRLDEIKEVRNV